jgi:hypothetical protein
LGERIGKAKERLVQYPGEPHYKSGECNLATKGAADLRVEGKIEWCSGDSQISRNAGLGVPSNLLGGVQTGCKEEKLAEVVCVVSILVKEKLSERIVISLS